MSTRRVVLGKQLDGTMGLRVSLPGFDALTDNGDDVHKFSFNSNWTDIIRTVQFGLISVPTIITSQATVAFPDQGYIPFVEARQADSNTCYDDRPINHQGSSWSTQAICNVSRGSFTVRNVIAPGSVFYIVFKQAAQ
jgi:hypothetical protein